jgi:hypothetical protein
MDQYGGATRSIGAVFVDEHRGHPFVHKRRKRYEKTPAYNKDFGSLFEKLYMNCQLPRDLL